MDERRYWRAGVRHLDELLAGGTPEALRGYFEERCQEWSVPYRNDEAFTVGIFDDLVALPPDAAFTLIPVATSIALEASGSERFELSIILLETLARIGDTTEMPVELAQAWPTLIHEAPSKMFRELRAWYRRP